MDGTLEVRLGEVGQHPAPVVGHQPVFNQPVFNQPVVSTLQVLLELVRIKASTPISSQVRSLFYDSFGLVRHVTGRANCARLGR